MNLEQIDTSTTAGKAEVMRLAAEGRRVAMRSHPGAQPMHGSGDKLYPWINLAGNQPSWNWSQCDYAIIAEPVGPEEVWIVHHEDGEQSLMSGKLAADEWVSNASGDKVVRYLRADLAGEGK